MPHFGRFDMGTGSNVAPRTVVQVTPTTSPYAYTAPGPGVLSIAGGTLSAVTYNRGGTITALGVVNGTVPVQMGDVVTVTWALSAPTLTFLPA